MEQFGDRIGIKKSAISLIESGRNGVTDQTIRLICREFNVNESWLRTGEGEPFVDLSSEAELMQLLGSLAAEKDDFKKELIKTLLMLPEEYWYLIRDEVKRLAQKIEDKEKPGDN